MVGMLKRLGRILEEGSVLSGAMSEGFSMKPWMLFWLSLAISDDKA